MSRVQFIHRGTCLDGSLGQLKSFLQGLRFTSGYQRRRRVQAHDVAFRSFPSPKNIAGNRRIVFRTAAGEILLVDPLQAELRWIDQITRDDSRLAF